MAKMTHIFFGDLVYFGAECTRFPLLHFEPLGSMIPYPCFWRRERSLLAAKYDLSGILGVFGIPLNAWERDDPPRELIVRQMLEDGTVGIGWDTERMGMTIRLDGKVSKDCIYVANETTKIGRFNYVLRKLFVVIDLY